MGHFFSTKIISVFQKWNLKRIRIRVRADIVRFIVSTVLLFSSSLMSAPLRIGSLPFPVNTLGDEFSPTVSLDGRLFFNARKGSHGKRDIYIVRLYDNSAQIPRRIKNIESSANDVNPYITSQGTVLVFSSNRKGSLVGPSSKESYDLYWSVMIQGEWSIPRPVPGDVNTPGDETNPAMNIAGDTLYYTHLPPGEDSVPEIRKARFTGSKFVEVQKMSELINSGAGEMSLFPAEDSDGFFFASKRDGGMGGWDLYFIHHQAGYFGVPVNLGPGINTSADETQPFKMGNLLYFASNRSGDYDLYRSFEYILDYKLSFRFVEQQTGKPVSVRVKLRAGSNSGEGGVYFAQSEFETDEDGRIQMYVHPTLKRLQLTVTDSNYLPVFQDVYVPHVALGEMKVELKAIRANESFDIHAIHFDYNSAKIRNESFDYLDSMVDYMKENTKIEFEIIGHTDLKGSASYNRKLSLKRAISVRNYLVQSGISESRFRVKGMGESRPLVDKTGKGFDEKNRRTEFRVIGKPDGT